MVRGVPVAEELIPLKVLKPVETPKVPKLILFAATEFPIVLLVIVYTAAPATVIPLKSKAAAAIPEVVMA